MKKIVALVAVVAGLAACAPDEPDLTQNRFYKIGEEGAELVWKNLLTGTTESRLKHPTNCRQMLNRFDDAVGDRKPKNRQDQEALLAGCRAKAADLIGGEDPNEGDWLDR